MDWLKLKFLKPIAPYASLILRVGLGLIMIHHGWQKISGGAAGVAGFFGSLGIPIPMVMAWIVIVVELVGGACILLGVLPRIWGLLFAIDMVVAIFVALLPKSEGFMKGYELELMIGIVALFIALKGGGTPALGPMLGLSDDDDD